MRVCVYVCVCVREREWVCVRRDRQGASGIFYEARKRVCIWECVCSVYVREIGCV